LDQDPWLLNCANGTLDLRTGTLREHDQADLITKLCPTSYDPSATCPEWDRFVIQIVKQEISEFLQRYFGYGLTGDVREQILAICHGKGANGKSTLFTAYTEMLGTDYAIKCDKSLITAKKHAGHSTERMDLFGKRFVITSETEEGEKLAESMIKDLTGGEVIRGRRMKEDSWQYSPTHKIILGTNHKPDISGTDHAIWRRTRLIPFDVIFWDPDKGESGPPELQQNKGLAQVFERNHPAILAWAVRGCLDWQRDGLRAPEAVNAATADYRMAQDRLSAFIADRCETSSLAQIRCKAKALYEAYKKWCEESACDPVSMTAFGTRMKERFKSISSNGTWYIGIHLKDLPEEEPEGLEDSAAAAITNLSAAGF
jgi:putative DNA primase/helicase